MPEITGIDLAKTLLTKFPFIKIIFISSYDDFIYAQEAIRLNICDYVEKPIDYDYLTTVIQKYSGIFNKKRNDGTVKT